jgi:type III secretion protein V
MRLGLTAIASRARMPRSLRGALSREAVENAGRRLRGNSSSDLRQSLSRRGDIAIVTLIVTIIVLMVLPIPMALLDFMIAISIGSSVVLLMMSVYTPSPVSLTAYPNLLLFTTLLRLSLNIATTKMILIHAHGGQIIETFGRLVVGGSALVGGVVFVVIAVVQFIVIAKGSERVAEVGARFTLDGMPGKQMSIDADLRAGLITKDEAKQRRQALEQESSWHGAMDGTMKFVKGDAICGLVIAFVNILAGIAVGVGMKDMSLAQAVQRYTLLTVGDGMVSQIPSLFGSVAAGILITRVASPGEEKSNVGRLVIGQVIAQPMVLIMTGAVLLLFLAVPGFPKLQFLLLGGAIAMAGLLLLRGEKRRDTPHRQRVPEMRGDAERLVPSLVQDEPERLAAPVLVRLSPSLQQVLDPVSFGAALSRERGKLYESIGLPFPGLRLRYDETLPERAYRILGQDIPMADGVLEPDMRWVRQRASSGQPAAPLGVGDGNWVDAASALALPAGTPTYTPSDVLAAHIGVVVRERASLFVGIQEVQAILEDIGRNQPELVQEVARAIPLQRIADILRRLLQEDLSIRNTREILESLIVWAPREKDVTMLTEYVRIDLGAMTTARFAQGGKELAIVMLSQPAEQMVREAIQETLGGAFLALGAERNNLLLQQAKQQVEQARARGAAPVIACSMDVRRHVKRALEATLPNLPVLSYQEVSDHVRVVPVGTIELDAGAAPALAK